jgi:hypothetical protein
MNKLLAVLVLAIISTSPVSSTYSKAAEGSLVQTTNIEQVSNVKCQDIYGNIGTTCMWNRTNYDYVFFKKFIKEDIMSREEVNKVVVKAEQNQSGWLIEDKNGITHTISNSQYDSGLLRLTIDERTLGVTNGSIIELVFYVPVHPKNTKVPFSYLYFPATNNFINCEKYSCAIPHSAVRVEFTDLGVDVKPYPGGRCAMPIRESSLEVIELEGKTFYFGDWKCPEVY